MPSAPRYDRYGRPLPEVTDAREASTLDHERNQLHRQLVARLIEDCWPVVCRRGWHGEVTLRVSVQDGMVQRDMRAGLDRFYRPAREGDPNAS